MSGNPDEVDFRFSEWTNSSRKYVSCNVLRDFKALFSKITWQFMLTHWRQYRVLVVVVLGVEGQENGGPSEVANNLEVFLVGLTNHILFPVRGFKNGRCSKPSAMTSLSTLIIKVWHLNTCVSVYIHTYCLVLGSTGGTRSPAPAAQHLHWSIKLELWPLVMLVKPVTWDRSASAPLLPAVLRITHEWLLCSAQKDQYKTPHKYYLCIIYVAWRYYMVVSCKSSETKAALLLLDLLTAWKKSIQETQRAASFSQMSKHSEN